MGHITLISEEILSAMEQHFPPELSNRIKEFIPQPGWDDYVRGDFLETKKKDTSLLGGGKPAVTSLARTSGLGEMRWRVDEGDSSGGVTAPTLNAPTPTGIFRRAEAMGHPPREASADFTSMPSDPPSDASRHVSSFLLYRSSLAHHRSPYSLHTI